MTTPPTIGAAIRFITSEPAPWLHMMGRRPIRIAMTVIILGRMRLDSPLLDRELQVETTGPLSEHRSRHAT